MFEMPPESYLWTYDLISPDEAVRRRALARHQALLAAAAEALHWSNRVWAQAGTPAPAEPHLAAEMDQARADRRWHEGQTIFGAHDAFFDRWTGPAYPLPYAPYVALYLRWEMEHPDEWGARESNRWS
ncbi:hypothetical protein F4553_000397 [Allocatelliglobosispora scoriae]|uniref:Uncharacterized protein n=1 Tax=Allocatelliglobosispora scoriae TaxID=643052 RepID=A0A841BI68_9ACTN|nr:hypothetical protein [Allocatelliglobosispora scoriae]MBB5867018.1 hypothetical protein [Allocatelliglobosispora scoriae]